MLRALEEGYPGLIPGLVGPALWNRSYKALWREGPARDEYHLVEGQDAVYKA
jgi:hypothetical protein